MTLKKGDEQRPQAQDRPDYRRRGRNLEWRTQWFQLTRSSDDRELLRILDQGLTHKRRLIERKRDIVNHRGGYAPAGEGTPWFSIGPRNVNGRVKSIAVHPTDEDVIYAGAASGGVWKSTDGGQSWRPLWDQQASLAVGALAVAPSDPDTIYVGTGEWTPGYSPSYPGVGVYVSTNGGADWTLHASVVSRRIARVRVSQDDPNTVYVAGANGFERSTNGGDDWSTIMTGGVSDAVIDPNDSSILYINVRNDGLYKSVNGGDDWDPLPDGPTGGDASWIRLAIGKDGANGSDLLLAKQAGTIYRSTNGGADWDTLAGLHGDASYHPWCSMIAVAPDDEDIILAGGVDIERTDDGGATDPWNGPSGLHSDHHVAVFAPSNPNVVYACNDGGVYRSDNKGATWKKASHGLVITQFYDVGAWSNISTVVGGGAQDNGSNLSTGGLTWHHILGKDGGYFIIHPTDPRTIYAEGQKSDIRKSIDGGNTWVKKKDGLTDGTPFITVLAMDPNDPQKLFVGTTKVFRTLDGCDTDWVPCSQLLGGSVTSITIAPSDSNRVYVAASSKIFRSDDGGATEPWAEKTAGLPSRTIKDVVVDQSDADRVMVCHGGTNSGGNDANSVFLSTSGGDGDWTDISGDLPNVPISAVAFDPNDADTLYAGTDVGVYRTTDLGQGWHAFDNGIPNVMITDLHVDPEDNLMYAATMGRGMYKISIAPSAADEPEVDLYLRDSVLDTGERFPTPSGLPNPVDPNDTVRKWESADIKVNTSPYYTPDALFDGVEFDEELTHDDPQREEVNRFYLQVHNRGWQSTTNVRVRAFFANAHAGLPSLPNPLVPPDFDLDNTDDWTPIGPAKTIPLLEPNRPVVVSWDWAVPEAADTHSCLIGVVSSPDDPITTTETNVDKLIKAEKRVCLKNLHVVDGSAAPGAAPQMVTIKFHNPLEVDDVIDIVINPNDFSGGIIGLLLERVEFDASRENLHGVEVYTLREGEEIGEWYDKGDIDRGQLWKKLDLSRIYEFDTTNTSELRGIKLGAKQTIQAVIVCSGYRKAPYGQTQRFAVMQRQGGEIVGGSTYEMRLKRAKGLHPVSRIRVTLEKVRILKDREPWFKGRGEFSFTSFVSFNGDACRDHRVRVPLRGNFKISDEPGRNEQEINVCVFDGYVAETDDMTLFILPTEDDWLDPDDRLTLFKRRFARPPETWVGTYRPGDEAAPADPEKLPDWMVWYRIESLKL